MEANNNNQSSLNIIRNFCSRFDIKPLEIPQEVIGDYAIVNPGVKDMGGVIEKLTRKLNETKRGEGFINGNEADTFNLISDWVRCSILVPEFDKAPALLEKLVQDLGGEITHHNRPDYKAFHLHFQRNGINAEIQIHTPKTWPLKQATAEHYEKFRDAMAKDPIATKTDPEYIEERNVMVPMCEEIYAQTAFDATLPMVEALENRYNQPVPPMQHEHFLIIERDAMQMQGELLNFLRQELRELSTNQTQNLDNGMTM